MMRKNTADRTWRCPDEVQLAALVDQRLSAKERAAAEAHVADCGYCLGQVAALTRLEQAGIAAEVPSPLLAKARALVTDRPAPVWRGWRFATSAAAVACCAVVLMISVRQPAPPAGEQFRSASGVSGAPRVEYPAEGASVARDGLVFRWRGIDQTSSYELRILTAEGDVVWETRVNGTEVRIPDTVRLSPGRKYYASIDAWLPLGKAMKYPIAGFTVSAP